MGRLDGKVALISGGARGMGNAEARLFAREGARVVIGDVAAADGAALAADIGDAARFVNLDVTAYNQWEYAVAETMTVFGRLDILVNNAGIVIPSPMRYLSLEDYQKVIDVNQTGVFLGIKAAAPAM